MFIHSRSPVATAHVTIAHTASGLSQNIAASRIGTATTAVRKRARRLLMPGLPAVGAAGAPGESRSAMTLCSAANGPERSSATQAELLGGEAVAALAVLV